MKIDARSMAEAFAPPAPNEMSGGFPARLVRDEQGVFIAYLRPPAIVTCRGSAIYVIRDSLEPRVGTVLRILAFDLDGTPTFMVVASVYDPPHTWSLTDPRTLEVSGSTLSVMRDRWQGAARESRGRRKVQIELESH
jgi:hypothetical protein